MTYNPGQPPEVEKDSDADKVAKWADIEFRAVSGDQSETIALELRPVFRAPTNPREGMIIYADGSSFNPGSGEGPYVYKNGAWVALIAATVAAFAPATQGRLTLATGKPVMDASVSGATTIYFSPHNGDQISIYDGSLMNSTIFTELSVATNDTTKSPAAIGPHEVHDWFVWSDSGTLRLGHGPVWSKTATITVTIAAPAVVTWTGHGLFEGAPVSFTTSGALPTGIVAGTIYFITRGATANTFNLSTSVLNALSGTAITTSGTQSGVHTGENRTTVRSTGTALVRTKGIDLNNASITNGPAASRGTYVGTTRSNGSSTLDWILGSRAAGGGEAFLNVWNKYNRIPIRTMVQDSTDSWTIGGGTFVFAANLSVGNRVNYVMGLKEGSIWASYPLASQPSAPGESGGGGVAFDVTFGFIHGGGHIAANTSTIIVSGHSGATLFPAIGSHYAAAVNSVAGTATWWGDGGGPDTSPLQGALLFQGDF